MRVGQAREPIVEPRGRASTWCLIVGESILVLLGAGLVAATAGLALGVRVGGWAIVPAAVGSAGFTAAAWRREGAPRTFARTALTLAACWSLIVLGGVAVASVHDTSTDGRHYQAESVFAIADGWNPLRDPALHWPPQDPSIWTNTYAKGPWILGAVVLDATGSIESVKVVGIAVLVAAALVSFTALSAAGLTVWSASALAAALALSPVVSAQLSTHMVDGVMSSVLLACLMLALLTVWAGPAPPELAALAAGLLLLVNVKFTGVFLAVVVVGGSLLASRALAGATHRRLARATAGLCAVVTSGVLLVGFNPYVTNTLRHGHPLYPIYGPHARNVETMEEGGSLRDHSAIRRLAESVAGASSVGPKAPRLKAPFTFASNEWSAFRFSEVRLGGFGPLFSGGLILAALAGIAVWVTRVRRARPLPSTARGFLVAAGLGVVATLATRDSFLARLVPELWFAPLLVLAAALVTRGGRVLNAVAALGVALLLANAVGVSFAALRWSVKDSNRQDKSLQALRLTNSERYFRGLSSPLDAEFGVWERAERRRLREARVGFRAVRRASCATGIFLTIDGKISLVVTATTHRPVTGVLFCDTTPAGAAGVTSPSFSSGAARP